MSVYGTLGVSVEGLDTEAETDDRSAHLCRIAVTSFDLLTVLVAAGYGIGIAPQSYIVSARNRGIVMRQILGTPRWVTPVFFDLLMLSHLQLIGLSSELHG
ncbi:hypothetical protein [Xanthomonas fragariae]|uniref:hypothetical protein n=1 Tax=Xanthomonas fragariae TaxID=48664 RepID=UPI001F2DE389|nr:hypothetical protein [Xanthomonas fragariae]